jgi:formylglycine-generating enzyme required for sulfatase activity
VRYSTLLLVLVLNALFAAATCKGEPVEGRDELVIESLSWEKVGNPVTHVKVTFTFYHPGDTSCWIALWGHDAVTHQYFPMQRFVEGNIENNTFAPRTYTFTWVAEENAPGRQSNDFQVFLRVSDEERIAAGRYLIIDVSGGPDADNYPVTYTDQTDPTLEKYKTNEIILRELPDGSYCGVYELTLQQYQQVTGETPSCFSTKPMQPIANISWNTFTGSNNYDNGFIALLRRKTGLTTLNLPTAEAWEYACRAGSGNDFNDFTLNVGQGSNDVSALANLAWYRKNSNNGPHDVGGKQPNAWGLYDMHGNIGEWTATEILSGCRAICDGYWEGDIHCRAGSVSNFVTDADTIFFGFRLALPAVQNNAAYNDNTGKRNKPFFVQANTDASVLGLIAGKYETVEGEGEFVESEDESIDGLIIDLPGGVPLTLVRVPAGTFMMGRYPDERNSYDTEDPQHQVTISQDFYLGRYELTQQQWLALMGSWPGTAPSSDFGLGDGYPACYVSWHDVQHYIAALNKHVTNTDQGAATFRLPTEAEWEYACRAGTTTRFYFGDSLDCDDGCSDCAAEMLPGNRTDYMWYCNNSMNSLKPVGRKLPNAFGLYDMSGNVWEWCQDWNEYAYPEGPATDPTGPPTGYGRVLRGGRPDSAMNCRSASRGLGSPEYRYEFIGFRLAR